jgi:hypothetical protein
MLDFPKGLLRGIVTSYFSRRSRCVYKDLSARVISAMMISNFKKIISSLIRNFYPVFMPLTC